jgi:hypothetical protein
VEILQSQDSQRKLVAVGRTLVSGAMLCYQSGKPEFTPPLSSGSTPVKLHPVKPVSSFKNDGLDVQPSTVVTFMERGPGCVEKGEGRIFTVEGVWDFPPNTSEPKPDQLKPNFLKFSNPSILVSVLVSSI